MPNMNAHVCSTGFSDTWDQKGYRGPDVALQLVAKTVTRRRVDVNENLYKLLTILAPAFKLQEFIKEFIMEGIKRA